MADEPTEPIFTQPDESPAWSHLGPASPPVNDVTHQVYRLARVIDRLSEGEYVIHLTKGTRWQPWHARIERDGEPVRLMDLFK